ncbi:MAG: pantoate--beta-alanine ligase [Calothrix sp. SM1_5_4]|nr:pantoate--beta-alanine ligase [Calothrix sp. SM1_5_4]
MRILESVRSVREWRSAKNPRETGFVPTMGALHAGHLNLVERARRDNDAVLISIFVNPTQFNDAEDLRRYPRPLEKDLDLLRAAGADAVFLPQPSEIYADGFRFEVHEKELSRILCGAKRPGHFEGVLTVVLKLLQITRPERAYFGEKDFQQLRLIQDMVNAFFLDVTVVPCPTVREEDGLAMSSRNLLLSPGERKIAPLLYEVLRTSSSAAKAKARLEEAGFRVDYVEDKWGRRFAAAFLGDVRLIDNVEL